MSTLRFNLRNASLFLSKLKSKYNKNKQEQNRDNTFIDEEEEMSSSNDSRKKKISQKLDSVTDRLFVNDEQMVDKSSAQQSVYKKEETQNVRQTFETIQQSRAKQHQTQFCDLIIIKYLEETLAVYKADLQTLQHNRDNLEQEIYFLGKKIGKLHQMQAENVKLQLQIQQLNEQLKRTIARYHQTNRDVWRQRLELSKVFNQQRNKLKKLFLLGKENYQNSVQVYFQPDSVGQGYLQRYIDFVQFKNEQQSKISQRLQAQKENGDWLNQQNQSLNQTVFKGKQDIYLRDHGKPTPDQPKSQIQPKGPPSLLVNQKKKEKKVVLYDENEHDALGQRPEQKQKPKKLSQGERAMLLGDLKNFSKSFKLPK